MDIYFCRYCDDYYPVDSCAVKKEEGKENQLICPQKHANQSGYRENAVCEALGLLRQILDNMPTSNT